MGNGLSVKKKGPVVDVAKGLALGSNVRWVDKYGKPFSDTMMRRYGAKPLTGGFHSESVWLLPDGKTVEKRYGEGKERKERMDIEVKILTRLKDCDFVPKLLDVDIQNRIVRMTYCGTRATESLKLRKKMDKLLRILEEQYGVYRKTNLGKRIYQLGQTCNVTTDGKKIYIIDFGSDHWQIKDPLL